jgi:hypothetical protein
MSKQWQQAISIALFVCFLVGFGLVVWDASKQSIPHNERQPTHSENRNNQNSNALANLGNEKSDEGRTQKHYWYDTFSQHPTEWLLVLFTLILAAYTARLYYATAALVRTERPHLIPTNLVLDHLRHAADTSGNIEVLFTWRFENHGRSPAFVRRYFFGHATVDEWNELPPRPPYGATSSTRFIIAPNGWYGSVKPNPISIPQQAIAAVLDGSKHSVIFGFIEYDSILGEHHKIRFAFSFEIGPGEKSERYFPVGPDSYWEYA